MADRSINRSIPPNQARIMIEKLARERHLDNIIKKTGQLKGKALELGSKDAPDDIDIAQLIILNSEIANHAKYGIKPNK
ncbi:hypothetical protein CYY_007882 [Polysphondylium violaceum]|uniref:Uncharacterized protein n=1 Tax=Polysphondylium violaceum TaxID=133409 RepID=A0A8J4PQ34_9MYCE|nr:hypothetical protein CYY_007882 [Polysphondylium violaceum]